MTTKEESFGWYFLILLCFARGDGEGGFLVGRLPVGVAGEWNGGWTGVMMSAVVEEACLLPRTKEGSDLLVLALTGERVETAAAPTVIRAHLIRARLN